MFFFEQCPLISTNISSSWGKCRLGIVVPACIWPPVIDSIAFEKRHGRESLLLLEISLVLLASRAALYLVMLNDRGIGQASDVVARRWKASYINRRRRRYYYFVHYVLFPGSISRPIQNGRNYYKSTTFVAGYSNYL